MCFSIKSKAVASLMSHRVGRVISLVKENVQRLSSGVRLRNGRHDPIALSVSIKLQVNQKELVSRKTNIKNSLPFFQNKESALSIAAKAVGRIAALKTLYSDPLESNADRENYNKGFKELAEKLTFLKKTKLLKSIKHVSSSSQNDERSQSHVSVLDSSWEYSQMVKNQLRLDVPPSFIGKAYASLN